MYYTPPLGSQTGTTRRVLSSILCAECAQRGAFYRPSLGEMVGNEARSIPPDVGRCVHNEARSIPNVWDNQDIMRRVLCPEIMRER